jgi:hypothetical protein
LLGSLAASSSRSKDAGELDTDVEFHGELPVDEERDE